MFGKIFANLILQEGNFIVEKHFSNNKHEKFRL